jgi:hypothetical protein
MGASIFKMMDGARMEHEAIRRGDPAKLKSRRDRSRRPQFTMPSEIRNWLSITSTAALVTPMRARGKTGHASACV